MTLPTQMFANMLNPLKGWFQNMALDYTAPISPNLLYDLRSGQVCHLNANGQLEPGVVAWQMPLFVFSGINEPDVNNQNNGLWWPISPTGKTIVLVGKGPYELWTTEFDTTQSYAPNQPLRAPTGLAANQSAISGVLTNQGVVPAASATPQNATAVCGIVSSGLVFTNGVGVNCYGVKALAFWSVYIPGNASET